MYERENDAVLRRSGVIVISATAMSHDFAPAE